MIDTLQTLIGQFGYLAVAIGCFIEGETAILLGLLAAQRDILHVEGVLIAAMMGTLIGDNVCFHIGRHMGRPALDKRPDWKPKVARVERLLAHYGAPMMIGFRFLYGLRYVTPFVFGSLGISPWRFLLLDAIGTVIWASTITFVGVYLASAVQGALAHIQNVEQALVVLVALAGIVGLAAYRYRAGRWRRLRRRLRRRRVARLQ